MIEFGSKFLDSKAFKNIERVTRNASRVDSASVSNAPNGEHCIMVFMNI